MIVLEDAKNPSREVVWFETGYSVLGHLPEGKRYLSWPSARTYWWEGLVIGECL